MFDLWFEYFLSCLDDLSHLNKFHSNGTHKCEQVVFFMRCAGIWTQYVRFMHIGFLFCFFLLVRWMDEQKKISEIIQQRKKFTFSCSSFSFVYIHFRSSKDFPQSNYSCAKASFHQNLSKNADRRKEVPIKENKISRAQDTHTLAKKKKRKEKQYSRANNTNKFSYN